MSGWPGIDLRILVHMTLVVAAGSMIGLAINRGHVGVALVGIVLLLIVIASYVLRLGLPPEERW